MPAQFVEQLPVYLNYHQDDFFTVVSQNFEDFLISIKDGNNFSIYPIIENFNQWNFKLNIYHLPCIEIYRSSEVTVSGQSNGLEIVVDLETFDNADIGVDYDALHLIIENKDNFPIFDMHGLSVKPGEMSVMR